MTQKTIKQTKQWINKHMFPLLSAHLSRNITKSSIAEFLINARAGIVNSSIPKRVSFLSLKLSTTLICDSSSIHSIRPHNLCLRIHRYKVAWGSFHKNCITQCSQYWYHWLFMPTTTIYHSAAVTYNQQYNNITATKAVPIQHFRFDTDANIFVRITINKF